MDMFNILAFIAAAVILIGNKEILDYAERKYNREGRPFNRHEAFILTMCAAAILIIKGIFF